MENRVIFRGLPHSLAMDGWWLDASEPGQGDNSAQATSQMGRRILAILTLLALGDFLFWRQPVGISTALFAFAIFALAQRGRLIALWWRPAVLLFMSALPVLDHLQALSLAFLPVGLVAALVWVRSPEVSPEILTRMCIRFLARLPRNWLRLVDPRRFRMCLKGVARAGDGAGRLRRFSRNWAFPVGGSLIFLSLLLDANPVLVRLLTVDLGLQLDVGRLLFWLGLAIFVAPFLGTIPEAETTSRPRSYAVRLPGMGINAGSVLRALVLFNLMIGVQSLTDLSIMVGGTALPEGITLAEYAHRGAYPLLATAILAGAFALAARPFLREHRVIKPLLLLWLAQNMVLCAAAALRLELYIDVFGLTYLRLYALIWMALVATGLGMMIWQVLRMCSNRWLLCRGTILGVGTLYLCSFVNFAQVIAAYNVKHGVIDNDYLCTLGPLAAGPIVASGVGQNLGYGVIMLGDDSCMRMPVVGNWREWGFRTWAANRYVLAVTAAEAAAPE